MTTTEIPLHDAERRDRTCIVEHNADMGQRSFFFLPCRLKRNMCDIGPGVLHSWPRFPADANNDMTADNLTRDPASQPRPMPSGSPANLDLRQALFSPHSVAIVGQSDDAGKTAGRPLKFLRQTGYAGRVYPINPRRDERAGRARLAVARGAAGGARPRLYRDADRGRGRGGRGMRPARRARWRPCSPTASRRPAREGLAREGAAARHLRAHRHAPRRPVEPRRGRPAQQGHAHRQRRVRRAGSAGRPHLRRLAHRQHDRRVAVARQGARHRLRRPGLGRQRGRSLARRDLRGDARRSRHRRLHAVSRNHAQGRGAARASRSRPRSAASRSSPTSSAARRRRASLRSRTPARSPARTTSPTSSSPIAASRGSTRSTA